MTIKKVLFYTSVPRLFRATLIGHLYEIAQVYPVVLLSEKLDEETEKVIRNKKLFPKLEKIVPVEQYTGRKMNLFARSKYLSTRRETRAFFEKAFFREKLKTANIDKKIITLMLPAENIGFRRKDLSLISEREREEERKKIIFQIVTILKGWKVYIKPHPETKQVDRIKKFFESISGNIKVVDPREPADKYIEMARVIVGLPLSASTTLFTASLQCPQKPILSLDFEKELLGDYYKNFEGIEYIDNEKDFLRILELIRDNKYYKKNYRTKLKADSFSNATELLEHLVQK